MKIEHQQSGKSGAFFIQQDEKKLALLNYKMMDKVMGITHTEVDPSQQNKNIGHQLLETAVIFARNNNLKIKPLCSFAEKVFETEFKDVLAHD